MHVLCYIGVRVVIEIEWICLSTVYIRPSTWLERPNDTVVCRLPCDDQQPPVSIVDKQDPRRKDEGIHSSHFPKQLKRSS